MLLWLGMSVGRAVDLALLITVPSLLVAAAKGLALEGALGGIDAGSVAVGLVIAFVAAIVAGGALRSLGERRRLPFLALWIIPSGSPCWPTLARCPPRAPDLSPPTFMTDARPSIYALILAGGVGTRFWPASRKARPKQLLP